MQAANTIIPLTNCSLAEKICLLIAYSVMSLLTFKQATRPRNTGFYFMYIVFIVICGSRVLLRVSVDQILVCLFSFHVFVSSTNRDETDFMLRT